MSKRNKQQKQVAFEPFKDSLILDIFDEDFSCPGRYDNSPEEMDPDALLVAYEMLSDDINDADIVIEGELESIRTKELLGKKADTSMLKMTRQRKQQLITEQRKIKDTLKMMGIENVKELLAS